MTLIPLDLSDKTEEELSEYLFSFEQQAHTSYRRQGYVEFEISLEWMLTAPPMTLRAMRQDLLTVAKNLGLTIETYEKKDSFHYVVRMYKDEKNRDDGAEEGNENINERRVSELFGEIPAKHRLPDKND